MCPADAGSPFHNSSLMTIHSPEEIERNACPAVMLDMWQARPTCDTIAPAYFRWKGVLDRVLAAILLIPGFPIIGALILLVRRTSKGPGIFVQKRVGKDGREFDIFKIRTMTHDAEHATGPVWAKDADPRTTPIGVILRRFHLDEFPQLVNVLKGEMSLVGPRPERPEFVQVLTKQIPGYRDRLMVPPGITGLAQLNLPPDSGLDSVRKKVAIDLDYIQNAGPLLDLRILLGTLVRLVKLPEGMMLRLLGLRRTVAEIGAAVPGSNGSNVGDHSPLDLKTVAGKALRHPTNGDGDACGDDGPSIAVGAPPQQPRKPR